MFLFLSALFYLALFFVHTYFLLTYSPLVFLGLVYLLPVLFNAGVLGLQRSKNWSFLSFVLLPTFAAMSYVAFAYQADATGLWEQFISLQSITDGDMTVEIAPSLLDAGQLIFMMLVYYGGALAQYGWETYKEHSKKKEVGYA